MRLLALARNDFSALDLALDPQSRFITFNGSHFTDELASAIRLKYLAPFYFYGDYVEEGYYE